MENTISTITTTLSPAALWEVVGNVMPFAAATTLFALGFYLVRRIMRKAKKAQGGI